MMKPEKQAQWRNQEEKIKGVEISQMVTLKEIVGGRSQRNEPNGEIRKKNEKEK